VDRELSTKYYVDNQIGTRQPTIDADTDLISNSLTTSGNINIGGVLNTNNPFFHYSSNTGLTISNDDLNYNGKIIDNFDAMDTSTGAYTIPKDGIYYFKFTIIVPSGTNTLGKIYKNNIQINGKGEFTHPNNNIGWTEASFFAYSQCSEDDVIKAYATEGRLQTGASTNFFTGYMIQ
jgi:hypothetical protein